MPLYILKHPNPTTLLVKIAATSCPAGYEPSTEAEAAAWVAAQLSAGWTPAPEPTPEPEPRSQSTDIVLSRLTDAEYDALTTSTVIGIRRAVDMARSTGVISEAHPAFAPFAAGANALGIIAADRWTALLAP